MQIVIVHKTQSRHCELPATADVWPFCPLTVGLAKAGVGDGDTGHGQQQ